MARKNYTDEFRRQAVDLYESTPGATLRGIAEDLGISRDTLSGWVKTFGTGSTTAPISTPRTPAGRPETQAEKVARLEGRERRAAGGEGEGRDREEDPSPGGQVFRWGDELVSRFQFVTDHRDAFEVKRLCEVIEVNRSSFYAWDAAAPARAERAAADEELAERIRAVHETDKAYGAPRVTADLNDGAPPEERVNRKRVARVMAEHNIAGIRLRRRVRTTVPEPADAKAPDLLKRDFTAQAPNRKYVGDITYLPLADGSNLYLATVIDCCSRKLAGWTVADHMRTSLVEDALKAALADRGVRSKYGANASAMTSAVLTKSRTNVSVRMKEAIDATASASASRFRVQVERRCRDRAARGPGQPQVRRHRPEPATHDASGTRSSSAAKTRSASRGPRRCVRWSRSHRRERFSAMHW
jgi:transposase InsO family protein/transposase-like protein